MRRFAVAALATWRLSHLLAFEDGPGDAVAIIRERAGDGVLGRLLDCFYCVSIWTAAPLAPAVARRRRDLPLAWLALSGAACLLERATEGPTLESPEATMTEATGDGLLREATVGV
ncbi:MAG TPA: DUF1360 domain-containing protein [Gaiellaceae bacterium]|nr:DUF1360 domain-containing protein [Gaiellaceae bacterium]